MGGAGPQAVDIVLVGNGCIDQAGGIGGGGDRQLSAVSPVEAPAGAVEVADGVAAGEGAGL